MYFSFYFIFEFVQFLNEIGRKIFHVKIPQEYNLRKSQCINFLVTIYVKEKKPSFSL